VSKSVYKAIGKTIQHRFFLELFYHFFKDFSVMADGS
jgi:hypothetical protein